MCYKVYIQPVSLTPQPQQKQSAPAITGVPKQLVASSRQTGRPRVQSSSFFQPHLPPGKVLASREGTCVLHLNHAHDRLSSVSSVSGLYIQCQGMLRDCVLRIYVHVKVVKWSCEVDWTVGEWE